MTFVWADGARQQIHWGVVPVGLQRRGERPIAVEFSEAEADKVLLEPDYYRTVCNTLKKES